MALILNWKGRWQPPADARRPATHATAAAGSRCHSQKTLTVSGIYPVGDPLPELAFAEASIWVLDSHGH